MKKGLILLFVVLMISGALAACDFEKPLCPDWAVTRLGTYCETQSLSITPPELVGMINWQVGEIQLWNAKVTNYVGVRFYTKNDVLIQPGKMEEGVFYTFVKTEPKGTFWLKTLNNDRVISPTIHIILARPVQ